MPLTAEQKRDLRANRKSNGESRAGEYLKNDPNNVIIVGIDGEGPEELLDEPSNRWEPSEEEIEYFVKNAQHTPGKCWRDGDKIYVAHGRKRVRKLRLANIKRVAAGLEPWPFIYTITQCPRNLLRTFVLSENFQRTELTFAEKSEYVRYLVEGLGKNPEEIRDELGCSVAQCYAYIAFGRLAAPVRARVDEGSLSATAALYLAELSETDQKKELANLEAKAKAGGRTKLASVREIRRSTQGGKPKPSERIAPTARELKVFAGSAQFTSAPKAAQEAVLWFAGLGDRPEWASEVDPGAIPQKPARNGKKKENGLFNDAPAEELPS